jgi:hypothetical protein
MEQLPNRDTVETRRIRAQLQGNIQVLLTSQAA